MAAGASSPEMFTSFIALFVDHSSLGVGTVVGRHNKTTLNFICFLCTLILCFVLPC